MLVLEVARNIGDGRHEDRNATPSAADCDRNLVAILLRVFVDIDE